MPKLLLMVFITLVVTGKPKGAAPQYRAKPKAIEHNAFIKTALAPSVADTVLDVIKAVVDGRQYTIRRTVQAGLILLNSKEEIIFRDSAYISDAKFKDFNNDGYKDIWIVRPGNVPGLRGLLLYNKTSKTFIEVTDFDRFPAPEAIKGTRYYYSYHRSGCADMNWTSDLFYLKNYKPVKIGTINGFECADSEIKNGIYIYRVIGGKNIKVKQMNITVINNHTNYKWGFVKDYWHQNYKLFL
ncbi:hypothetical protein [Mucilaginibacter sp. AK015]|uniref:XAC2610-related protein n=1 Tax=Mucilaginibacter sp. AK015 TaxID=2723072 RepID=UPI00160B43E3|nr:hypothetical protein [Mucilaginibacter sp. AK015]MBB5394843.1 hypothetical protein [Mucilaginibacter sp. AK015]